MTGLSNSDSEAGLGLEPRAGLRRGGARRIRTGLEPGHRADRDVKGLGTAERGTELSEEGLRRAACPEGAELDPPRAG